MKWLLWREYRLNRWILVTGAVLILLSYLIDFIMTDNDAWFSFFGAWLLSCLSGYVTVALLAGNAIAGQRADRSAEFIAYLPLGRWRIVASKLLLFLMTFAVICAVTVGSANLVSVPVEMEHYVDLRGFIIATLIIYGVGWMFTSLLSSPAYATLAAFCSAVLISWGVWTVATYLGVPVEVISNKDGHEIHIRRLAITGLPLAIVCFCVGTWHYVRREP